MIWNPPSESLIAVQFWLHQFLNFIYKIYIIIETFKYIVAKRKTNKPTTTKSISKTLIKKQGLTSLGEKRPSGVIKPSGEEDVVEYNYVLSSSSTQDNVQKTLSSTDTNTVALCKVEIFWGILYPL